MKNKHSQKLPKVSHSKGWTWWHMPAIPEPGRMKPPVMSTSLAYRESPSEAGDRVWFSQGSTGSARTKRRLQITYYTSWAQQNVPTIPGFRGERQERQEFKIKTILHFITSSVPDWAIGGPVSENKRVWRGELVDSACCTPL